MATFKYSSAPQQKLLGPIWPDFDQNSNKAKNLVQIKSTNGPNYWSEMRKVFDYDCKTLPLDRFKAWTSIMSVPLMSNHRHSEYIRLALQYANESDVYKEALIDPLYGMNEDDYNQFYSLFSDIKTTMNRVQLLGHLIMTGFTHEKLMSMDSILEIGAGVGDMADIIYKLGFKGKYYIYDFEELKPFQQYNHNQSNLETTWVHNTEDLSKLNEFDLTIATWSLTEMPLDFRDEFLSSFKTKNWLLAYSKKIFGIDNQKWVNDKFLNILEGKEVLFIDIPWMPWDSGTAYIVATEK